MLIGARNLANKPTAVLDHKYRFQTTDKSFLKALDGNGRNKAGITPKVLQTSIDMQVP